MAENTPRHESKIEPIAIIGMGCRLSGGVDNVEDLWLALAGGQSGWSLHPTERHTPEIYYHPNSDRKGTFSSKGAHYLQGDVKRFDASFFNMTATEAVSADPQQRHLMEVSYEAIESAGLRLDQIAGSQMGVFVGLHVGEYRSHLTEDVGNLPALVPTGTSEALLSNRLSYFYDLRGPSFSIDTVCSSSLVAFNAAFKSLQVGECSSALVGSSVLRLDGSGSVALASMRLLSSEGRCRSFDDRGTSGYGRGEGIACLVLKPLSKALRDGDPIRAVVRNTGVNQDGKTNGITMPNGEAQSSLIESVYKSVELCPGDTQYVEAHGTGTYTGDPIEAFALGRVFRDGENQPPLIIGSSKSNFGHLEAASGAVALIKAALMLERKFLLPNHDLRKLNQRIPFEQLNLKVSDKYTPWYCRGTRRASVNNFGFGGANAHAILEEHIPVDETREIPFEQSTPREVDRGRWLMESVKSENYLFVFSAYDRGSLLKTMSLVAEYVSQRPVHLYPSTMKSLAFTLSERRSLFQWRFATYASTHAELATKLRDASVTPVRSHRERRVGFAFTGQGANWPQMGMTLAHAYPVCDEALKRADHTLSELGAPWSLITELEAQGDDSKVSMPHFSQPACTAVQIALVDLYTSWGIKPERVTGHSSGEIAAAYAMGALSAETCMAIAYYRGLVASKLAEESLDTPGAMLAVAADEVEVSALISSSGFPASSVNIACYNSPLSMTVSGDRSAIERVSELADAKSIWNRRLNVGVAYHSRHMDKVAVDYTRLLGNVCPKKDTVVEFHSSLEGRRVAPEALDAAYWKANLISPVQFTKALTSMCAPSERSRGEIDVILEIGPHSALQGPIRQVLQPYQGKSCQIEIVPSLLRNSQGTSAILDSAAQLISSGCPLNPQSVNHSTSGLRAQVLVDLPTYSWNHDTQYWHESRIATEHLGYMEPRHDLLGVRVKDCAPQQPQWTNHLSVDDAPWLRDHRIGGVVVFPLAGYLTMAFEACRQSASWEAVIFDRVSIRNVNIRQALVLLEGEHTELRFTFAPQVSQSSSTMWNLFRVSSWNKQRGWLTHCDGQVGALPPETSNAVQESVHSAYGLSHRIGDFKQIVSRCTVERSIENLYQQLADASILFGPTFRVLTSLRTATDYKSVAEIVLKETASLMPCHQESKYLLHPTYIDGIFQTAIALLSLKQELLESYVPTYVGELTISMDIKSTPGTTLSILSSGSEPEAFLGKRSFDYALFNQHDSREFCVLVVKNLIETPMSVSDDKSAQSMHSRCLKIEWQPAVSFEPTSITAQAEESQLDPSLSDNRRSYEELARHYVQGAIKLFDERGRGDTKVGYLSKWMSTIGFSFGASNTNGDSPEQSMQNGESDLTSSANTNGNIVKVENGLQKFPEADKNSQENLHGVSARSLTSTADNERSESLPRSLSHKLRTEDITVPTKASNGVDGSDDHAVQLKSSSANGSLGEPLGVDDVKRVNGYQTEGAQEPSAMTMVDVEPASAIQATSHQKPSFSHIIHQVGLHLPSLLQGECTSEDLAIKYDLTPFSLSKNPVPEAITRNLVDLVKGIAFQDPDIKILEVDQHSAAVTEQILASLPDQKGGTSNSTSYELTHGDADSLAESQKRLPGWSPLLKQTLLNVEQPKSIQDSEPRSYDLIIAWKSEHKPLQLNFLRGLMRPEARLIVLSRKVLSDSPASLPFQIIGQSWVEQSSDLNLEEHGLVRKMEVLIDDESGLPCQTSLLLAMAPPERVESGIAITIISTRLPECMSQSALESAMHKLGVQTIEWVDFEGLSTISLDGKYCVIIEEPDNVWLAWMSAQNFENLKILTAAAGILWITGGINSPESGLVHGFARTIRAEAQMEKLVTLTIDDWGSPVDSLLHIITRILDVSFLHRNTMKEFDREYAVINGIVKIPRLVQENQLDRKLKIEAQPDSKYTQPFSQEGRNLRLDITNPGFLNSLNFVDDDRFTVPLADDEVEIEIKASGLNFKDVILALGQLPGHFLGQECSGTVSKVGAAVTELKVHDRVCAILPGSIGNRGRAKVHCVVRLPEQHSFASGASIPLIYCTARYCLAHVARLAKGEAILIHAAAGGVGQAAIMLAQAAGANIFASVGSPEKKTFLMDTYGIPAENILYSRGTSFAEHVMRMTKGRGVDVVLNSLAGEQLRATWKCIAPFGRFIEIGKKDIVSNSGLEMSQFERTVTFAAVDLGDLVQLRPVVLRTVFQEVISLLSQNVIQPVSPIHEYPMSQAETAFRALQSGKLTGKIVLVPSPNDMILARRPNFTPPCLRSDVSYLITGGTGGIGRSICTWMARNGASHIILASRSGKMQQAVMRMVDELNTLGVAVAVVACNVAEKPELISLVTDCETSMPPIGGVIHGAYVNKDVPFEACTYQDWIDVVRPKYQGAINLDEVLRDHELDFFVMLSSISGIIGNRGQAAYAAANAFLDAFAQNRVSRGLKATSIDLGVVKEIGHVAERADLQDRLKVLGGDTALGEAEVLALTKLAITGQINQHANNQCIAGLRFEGFNAQNSAWFWATDARFSHLRSAGTDEHDSKGEHQADTKQALRKIKGVEQATTFIVNSLVLRFADLLMVQPEDISLEKSLVAMGLDSLIAIEIRTWMAKELEAKVSTMELMTIENIQTLATLTAERSALVEAVHAE